MESINRLRAYVERHARMGSMTKAILTEMASVIEHDVECERTAAYNAGYDAGFVDDNYDADATAQHEDAMAERGWVRLPLDADGEPIHIGDVMEWDNGTFTVHELKVTEDGWTTWDEQHGYTVHVDMCHHHHAPTVEDVLREFADAMSGQNADFAELVVTEYAAKLTLRGDE